MSYIVRRFKEGTSEKRIFIVPEDGLEASCFEFLANSPLHIEDSIKWPCVYDDGSTGNITVLRYWPIPLSRYENLKQHIKEKVNFFLTNENHQLSFVKEAKILTYYPPYDKNEWSDEDYGTNPQKAMITEFQSKMLE